MKALNAILIGTAFARTLLADVTFSDTNFADGDWEVITLANSSGGTATGEQDVSEGNPPPSRRVSNVLNGGGVYLIGFHFKASAIYDPVQNGAIACIDYREDSKCFGGGGDCQATGPALRQSGRLYIANQNRFYLITPEQEWTSRTLNRLTASDFDLCDPTLPDFVDSSQHPDFSTNGSQIQFGFQRSNSTGGGGGHNITAGIDNWNITVRTNCIVMSIRFSEVEVCWNSRFGELYQVQYRTNLGTTFEWTPLSPFECVRGNGTTNCVTDAIKPGDPRRFYRVIETNCVLRLLGDH